MSVRVVVACLVVLLAGACGGNQRRPPEAEQASAVTTEPVPASPVERARAHTELGVSYYRVGQLGVALEEFKQALAADPKYVPALNAMGLVYMGLNEDDKARASFERALKVDPNDSDVNNNYGLFLCDRRREKESLKYFLAAVRNPLYRTPEEAYVNAGICARRAGDDQAAEQYFQRALSARPGDPRALIGLAQLLYQRGDYAQARTYMTQFAQRVPSPDAGSLWLGARINQRLGDQSAVLSYGAQLQSRFPDAPETRAYNEGRFE
jgi:type IV pilus assembly protein PilF